MATSSSHGVAPDVPRSSESKDLPILRRLGKGLSGFLYETASRNGIRHARKDFPLGSKKHAIFVREASALPDLEHPNIVKCFGHTVGRSSCSLLQEYVDDNLQTTIQKRIEAQRKKNSTRHFRSRVLDVEEVKRLLSSEVTERGMGGAGGSSSRMAGSGSTILPFEMREAVRIISEIATGMKYLHDNGVVHGDLKPKNVLLCLKAGEIKVKVADFGLVETKRRIKLVSKRTRHREILAWKAPELLERLLGPVTEDSDDPFTDSDTDSEDGGIGTSAAMGADVYSFGLTCSLILGGKVLFPELGLTQLREQRMKGYEPDLPPTCPAHLKSVIHSCLERKPGSRPSFSTIFSAICTLSGVWPKLRRWDLIEGTAISEPSSFSFLVVLVVWQHIVLIMCCTLALIWVARLFSFCYL